jgi:hypothetical protein
LHFRYSPAGDHATLTVSVPTKYLDVEFHYAQIQIGDDPENEAFLRFDAGMTRRHGMASTRITLPRKHPLVKFRAIYVRENRMAELIAEFRPSGRVR